MKFDVLKSHYTVRLSLLTMFNERTTIKSRKGRYCVFERMEDSGL